MSGLALARTSRACRGGLYGVSFASEGNSNTTIGQYSTPQKVSYRERIDHTGSIQAVDGFLKSGSGYSLGTGGTIIMEIQTDDNTINHRPTGTVLASVSITPGNPGASVVGTWTLGTPLAVTKGQLLHFVFRNTDANPVANFISLNGLELHPEPTKHQPQISNIDRALLIAYDLDPTPWAEMFDRYPIIDIEYVDGYHGGQGYYAGDRVAGQKLVNGTQNMARLNFTPPAPRIVSRVQVYLFKQSGTTQPLVVTLRNSGGTSLASCSYTAAEVATGTTVDGYGARWTPQRALSTPVALTAATQYFLELSSPGETVPYIVFPVEGGGLATFGLAFLGPNIFTEGALESTTNGGSSWSLHAGTIAWKMMAYFS